MSAKGGMWRPRAAHSLLFPAAALYAVLVVPASVTAMQTREPLLPGLATATGHGHEMLFGFALAVVAGFLLNRVPGWPLHAMLGLWLAARVAYALHPTGLASDLLNIAFAGWVAAATAPRFIRAAKKPRNRIFGPVLVALGLTAVAYHLAGPWSAWAWRPVILHEAIVLFATLMFFMGGRIIAPAAAGYFYAIGEHLEARVQPRLEGAGLVLLGTAFFALPVAGARPLAAAALIAAGLIAGARLGRWRLWRCRGRPDLVGLGVGYAWLSVGLMLIGAALLVEAWRFGDALHALTVGALGTLTISVMARTRMQRAKLPPAAATGIPLALGFISVAALARLGAPLWAIDAGSVYWLAALSWSLGYLLLLRLLWRVPGRQGAG